MGLQVTSLQGVGAPINFLPEVWGSGFSVPCSVQSPALSSPLLCPAPGQSCSGKGAWTKPFHPHAKQGEAFVPPPPLQPLRTRDFAPEVTREEPLSTPSCGMGTVTTPVPGARMLLGREGSSPVAALAKHRVFLQS